MKKYLMIASAAAMAVTMPALAKPENGNKGGGKAAAQGAGGNGGGNFKPQKANGGGNFKQAEKAQKQQFKGAERQVKAEQRAAKDQNKAAKNQNKQAERVAKAQNKQAERFAKDQNKAAERYAKDQNRVAERRFNDSRFNDSRFDDNRLDDGRFAERVQPIQYRNGGSFCPPGLAKKNNGCLPPGQAKKVFAVGQQLQSSWYPQYNLPQQYHDFYSDNSNYYYRYDDTGYIYRVDRENDLVSGLIPLLGGGFGVGQALPAGYNLYNVPLQYRDTYYDTDESYYRYGDNAIYQVDPQSQMIENVVALLTGDSFGVGQTLPAGYDMYNVPTQYRDQYYDTDQYDYRYADGNIYQVDAKTQIIQSIISALI